MKSGFELLDHVPVGIAVCGADLDVRFWNACIEDWTGIRSGEIVGKTLPSFFPRFDCERYRSRLSLLLEGGPPVIFSYQLNGCLFPSRGPDRLERVQHVTATSFVDEGGDRLILIAVEDRTEVSKRIRDARTELAKRVETEAVLRKAIEEKEYLMRELNHRVKNNLNMIVSLINLQKEASDSDALSRALADIESRIHSFATLHEALQSGSGQSVIPIDGYLGAVVGELFESHKPAGSKAQLSVHIDPIELPYSRALYLGLIASETVTNSLKYGLDGDGNGSIRVALRRTDSGFVLSVEDDGPGFPAGYDPAEGDSLGLNLVRLFAEDIGGKAEFAAARPHGARVAVSVSTGT